MSKRYRDEDDVRGNNSRQFGASNKARPRTKDRPDYSAAQTGRIIEVDRGRVKCLITGSQSLSQSGEPIGGIAEPQGTAATCQAVAKLPSGLAGCVHPNNAVD